MSILVNSVEAPLGAPVIIAPYLSRHTWSRGGIVLNDRGAWPRYWVRETGLRDSADVEDRRDPSPGAHGEIPRHAVWRGKTVPYSGTVEGRTLAEVWVARERLLSAFSELNPEGRMTVALTGIFPLVMGDGTFARAPDVFYDARPLQVTCPDVPPRPQGVGYALDFSLALRMSDARLYETAEQGPIALTPYESGAAPTTTVNSPGTADSDPTFTLHGPFTTARLWNDTVGATWRLVHTLVAGQSVTVDFQARTAILSDGTDVSNSIDYTFTDWWDETIPWGRFERVYISKAGRDNIVVDDALQLHCDTVHSAYSKRYVLRHEGQSNSNKFTKCRFAQADQWGMRFIGGKATFDTCTFEANSRDAAVAYGGVWFDPNDADVSASIQVTFLGCHIEFNNGPLGTGIPLQISSGIRPCVVTEINSTYADTATLQCVIAEGEFTSIGVATNLTTHANCDNANSVLFLHPRTAVGAGSFQISDPDNIAIIIGASAAVGSTQPGGGIKIGDVELFRYGVGRLRLDTARYEAMRAAATDGLMSGFVSGDAIERFLTHASGKMHWGDGTAFTVTMERSTTGKALQTNGAFRFTAMAAADAPNNSIFLDSADNVIKRKDNAGAVAAI